MIDELVLCQNCSHPRNEHRHAKQRHPSWCHSCECPGFVPEPAVL